MALVELRLKNVASFRTAIHALVDHLPQVNLQFGKEGLSIRGMDSSHTSLVSYFLSKQDCTSYKCQKSHVVGIHLMLLDRILKITSSGEEMTLTIQPGSDTISVLCKEGTVQRSSEIPTLDIEVDEIGEADESILTTHITMSTSKFVKYIKDFSKYSADNILFQVNEDGFTIGVNGDMKGSVLFEPSDDCDITTEDDIDKSEYSLKIIHGILVGAADLSSTLQISFHKDTPVRFTFLFGKSKFTSYTASKVIDD
jgi:proliferating cell nuclear antigen PCNA